MKKKKVLITLLLSIFGSYVNAQFSKQLTPKELNTFQIQGDTSRVWEAKKQFFSHFTINDNYIKEVNSIIDYYETKKQLLEHKSTEMDNISEDLNRLKEEYSKHICTILFLSGNYLSTPNYQLAFSLRNSLHLSEETLRNLAQKAVEIKIDEKEEQDYWQIEFKELSSILTNEQMDYFLRKKNSQESWQKTHRAWELFRKSRKYNNKDSIAICGKLYSYYSKIAIANELYANDPILKKEAYIGIKKFAPSIIFSIEALQRTFYPLGIQFAVVEDDFCSADKTAEEVAEYFNGKTIDKIRSEFITNRQNHFEEGTLTHRQAKYGYALSEDRRNLVLNPESAQVVKLIFQMYLEDMKIPEIARALEAQGVPSPQIQMAKKKRSRTKIKWPDSTIRSILKNPLYIGKCTLTLAKAKRELEVPAIVSKTEFQKAQKKLESTRLPSRKKARKKPNLLFKKIYDKESGKGLLCRTSEDESRQIYSFDKGYRCFSGKAPFIESEKIFREILSALEKEKMQAAHIDRVLDLNPEKVKQCMDAGLLQYRKKANEIVARLMAKDDERTAVYREYEQESISLEQVEEYEHQYQVAVQKQEAAFKKVMLAVNDIEKAFSHGNPWLMKFREISIPEKLERTHLKEWLDHVWIVDFEQVEVILQESKWKGFFPEEWLNNGEEDCNGKKE